MKIANNRLLITGANPAPRQEGDKFVAAPA
jgi:hypothetical protein